MNKVLKVTIEAKFDIDDEFGGLEVVAEAIEKLREQGEAKVLDASIEENVKKRVAA